jgi:hypothetical protein
MKSLVLCVVLAFFFVGCGQVNPSLTSRAYPSDQGVLALKPTPFPSVIQTPLGGTGTITGKLVTSPPGRSPAGVTLYLAALLPLTPGPDYLIGMDLANSPRTVVYEDGRFLFPNIAPNRYALVLWTPNQSAYAQDPANSDKELIVTVAAGQIVELGDVTITMP